ncbi:Dephospho-CoA kinase [Serratia symbiotica]|nr:Dephospho-CoA kinase [Serratia symbiotica]
MAYIVALTGGIGSGKSTIAKAFARYDVSVVDTDAISRQVVELGTKVLAKISERFGSETLEESGVLNRALLRQRIFSQPDGKIWLNQFLHPLICQEVQRQLVRGTSPYVLWEVPLLVENSLQDYADRVLVIDVSKETQLARTVLRNRISPQEVRNILSAQATRAQRLAIADDVIDNSGTAFGIALSVDSLHRRYLKLASSYCQ